MSFKLIDNFFRCISLFYYWWWRGFVDIWEFWWRILKMVFVGFVIGIGFSGG